MADQKSTQAEKSDDKDAANSGYNYNPILQKPASLPPVGKHGGFYYFGPPPDAGFSYGVYADSSGNKVVSLRGEEMYSPFDGKPMQFEKEIKFDDAKDLVQQGALAGMTNICSVCATQVVSNVDNDKLGSMKEVHCTSCGAMMPEALNAMRMAAGLDVAPKEQAEPEAPAKAEEKEQPKEEAKADEPAPEEKPAAEDKKPESEEKPKGEDEMQKTEAQAKVSDILVKLKTFQKDPNAVAEADDKEVADKIESLSEEEKKMLADEMAKDPELKTLADEMKADEAAASEAVLPGQPAAPAHKPDMSKPDATADEEPAEEEKPAEADEEAKEEEKAAHAAVLRKVLKVTAKLKVMAEKAEEVKPEDDKAMADEIEEMSDEEKAMLADEVKEDKELAAVVEKIINTAEAAEAASTEVTAASMRKVFSLVAKLKVMSSQPQVAEADDKAVAEQIAAMTPAEQTMLVQEIQADKELENLANEVEKAMTVAHEEAKEEKPAAPAAADEAAKEEEKEAAKADEGHEGEHKESPVLEAEEMEELHPAQADEAAAVHHEPLAAVSELGDVSVADVKMERWNEGGENPFYNISIKGSPVAQIYLLDQPNPDEIRATFVTDTYAEAVRDAIAKVGVAPTLKSIKAKYFATAVSKSKFASKVADKVRNELAAEYKGKVAQVREDLLHCVAIVLAGANKNFFADMDNSLKASLYEEMSKAGVYEPVRIIESAFDSGADKFFEFVLSKAVEYMDMPKQALAEVAKAIGSSSTLQRIESSSGAAAEAPTLAAKLAANSIPVRAAAYAAEDSVGMDKETLRDRLKLGKKSGV